MPIILLHSSKTMRTVDAQPEVYQTPGLFPEATQLMTYLHTLSTEQLASYMLISPVLARRTQQQIADWINKSDRQLPALDAFLGDIYSGLQVSTFTIDDRDYANDHLYILSGLYGALRALDTIRPYRLEMGYRLPDEPYRNLYKFWGERIAALLPATDFIVNVSAVEYTKAVLPHIATTPVITPKFLTRDTPTGEAKFVTVHAKIARGAFAHWLIKHRVSSIDQLHEFNELGYVFSPDTSTETTPVFICDTFRGLGLSVRLT
jgi:cytoplasmic iron level regulating protein YaaA (DUF328/UPF0246 family)